jgi:twitching motility two-component system response regulator PilG
MIDKRALSSVGRSEPYSEALPVLKTTSLALPEEPPGGENASSLGMQSHYCALVIEGSLTVRTIIRICLRRAGLLVFDFPDGLQALRWLGSSQACMPDLILLDTDIPPDWYTIVRSLQKQPACLHTMLVLLSRRDGLVDHLKARLAGARAYIAKPFRTQELLEVVQRCLRFPGPMATR